MEYPEEFDGYNVEVLNEAQVIDRFVAGVHLCKTKLHIGDAFGKNDMTGGELLLAKRGEELLALIEDGLKYRDLCS